MVKKTLFDEESLGIHIDDIDERLDRKIGAFCVLTYMEGIKQASHLSWNSICTITIMKEETIKKAARILLGANLIFAGISHLTFARKAFKAQVPDWVPLKIDDTVLYSGIAEIALGSALVLTPKQHEDTVGKIAAGFFTAVFPGNISQYTHHRSAFGLDTDKKRFVRLLFQPVLVYWALKSTSK